MSSLLRWITFNLKYFGKPVWDTDESPPELLEFIKGHPAGRALDMGCGTGTNLVTLAHNGWQVTGVEYVWLAVRRARKKLKQTHLPSDIFWHNVADIDFIKDPFDFILDIGCYHGLTQVQRKKYQLNVIRLLKPEGHFMIYAYLATEHSDFGFGQDDLDYFMKDLQLVEKKDGIGNKDRPSSWILFKNG